MSEPGPPTGRRAAGRPTVSAPPIRDPRADDGPTVWSRCDRCGQLRHVTADRCPSCGLSAFRASEPPEAPVVEQDPRTAPLSAAEIELQLSAPSHERPSPERPSQERPAQERPAQERPAPGRAAAPSRAPAHATAPEPSRPARDEDDAARIIASLVAPLRRPAVAEPVAPAPEPLDDPAQHDAESDHDAEARHDTGEVPTVSPLESLFPSTAFETPFDAPLDTPGALDVPPSGPPPRPAQAGIGDQVRTAWDQVNREARRRPGLAALSVAAAGVILLLIGALVNGATSQASPSAGATAKAAASPVRLTPASAGASSTQNPEGGVSYEAANTLDGKLDTAWNSDGRRDGKGPGMSLTYTFGASVDLRSITVSNGYQKLSPRSGKSPLDLYPLNARLRTVRVVTDGGSTTWNLKDVKDPQTLSLGFGRTATVRLEVVAVYPGSKYLDLAISEVAFAGVT